MIEISHIKIHLFLFAPSHHIHSLSSFSLKLAAETTASASSSSPPSFLLTIAPPSFHVHPFKPHFIPSELPLTLHLSSENLFALSLPISVSLSLSSHHSTILPSSPPIAFNLLPLLFLD